MGPPVRWVTARAKAADELRCFSGCAPNPPYDRLIIQVGRYDTGDIQKDIRLSTLDFVGVLRITDVEAIAKALHQGIGPTKAFGRGLLLAWRV